MNLGSVLLHKCKIEEYRWKKLGNTRIGGLWMNFHQFINEYIGHTQCPVIFCRKFYPSQRINVQVGVILVISRRSDKSITKEPKLFL